VVPDTEDAHGPEEEIPSPDVANVSNTRQEDGKKNAAAAIVFFSNVGLNILQTCMEINIDGTFTTAPSPFRQILFVQAKQPGGKRSIPVLFALLTKKVIPF
jgi:hypothetical protein